MACLPAGNSRNSGYKRIGSAQPTGDAPKPFVARHGIPAEEWGAVRCVYVIRSCALTPFLTNNTTYAEYLGNFMNTIRNVLAFVANSR